MDWSGGLKAQLRSRVEGLLAATPTSGYRSLGTPPTVLSLRSVNGDTHGNFFDASSSAIKSDPRQAKRLAGKRTLLSHASTRHWHNRNLEPTARC